jgi:hypothetical protein
MGSYERTIIDSRVLLSAVSERFYKDCLREVLQTTALMTPTWNYRFVYPKGLLLIEVHQAFWSLSSSKELVNTQNLKTFLPDQRSICFLQYRYNTAPYSRVATWTFVRFNSQDLISFFSMLPHWKWVQVRHRVAFVFLRKPPSQGIACTMRN